MKSHIFVLLAAMGLFSCSVGDNEQVCLQHPSVCQAYVEQKLDIIAMFEEYQDPTEIKAALAQQGIEVKQVYDVTPQMLLSLSEQQFYWLAQYPEFKSASVNGINELKGL